MTEFDTPDLSRRYCPLCEPDADPTREILQVKGYWMTRGPDFKVSASVDKGKLEEWTTRSCVALSITEEHEVEVP